MTTWLEISFVKTTIPTITGRGLNGYYHLLNLFWKQNQIRNQNGSNNAEYVMFWDIRKVKNVRFGQNMIGTIQRKMMFWLWVHVLGMPLNTNLQCFQLLRTMYMKENFWMEIIPGQCRQNTWYWQMLTLIVMLFPTTPDFEPIHMLTMSLTISSEFSFCQWMDVTSFMERMSKKHSTIGWKNCKFLSVTK